MCLKERETTSEKAPQQRNAHTNTQMSHSYCHRTGFITNNSLGSDVETRFGNDDSVICVCECGKERMLSAINTQRIHPVVCLNTLLGQEAG